MSHSLVMLDGGPHPAGGFGAAGVMSVNGALVRHTYPQTGLGHGIGMNAMVVSASSAIGPTVAAGILAVGPWQWLFGINIPIGLAALAVGWMNLPMNPLSERRFDWLSATLNALTFGLVITGTDVLTRTKSKLTGAVELIAGLAFGWVLVVRELARPRPLVPFDLLTTKPTVRAPRWPPRSPRSPRKCWASSHWPSTSRTCCTTTRWRRVCC